MSQDAQFSRLEKFVSKLLSQYDKLREKNVELLSLLQQRDEEIHQLKAAVNSAENERGDVINRVKGLIDQIEEWELALEESEETIKTKKSATETEASEALNEVEEGDKESSLQQNLFNVEPRANGNIGS